MAVARENDARLQGAAHGTGSVPAAGLDGGVTSALVAGLTFDCRIDNSDEGPRVSRTPSGFAGSGWGCRSDAAGLSKGIPAHREMFPFRYKRHAIGLCVPGHFSWRNGWRNGCRQGRAG